MIFPQYKGQEAEAVDEPLIVPLAIPMTAGPSAIATVLLLATRNPNRTWAIFLAVVIASIIFTMIILLSRYLMRVLGSRALTAIERLMGMILTTVAVQMFLSGVWEYLHPVGWYQRHVMSWNTAQLAAVWLLSVKRRVERTTRIRCQYDVQISRRYDENNP